MYKEVFGLKIFLAIFYNHESPRRTLEYVTKKIVKHACEIKLNKRKIIELGDVSAKIDWGYAREYVESAYKIMQQKKPDIFIIATGRTISVKQFLIKTFNYLKLDWKRYLKIDPKLFRPSKTSILSGDISKAKKVFGYKVKTNIDELIKLMVDHELNSYEKN
jgi:GDPmannose 4,6-dehydratase